MSPSGDRLREIAERARTEGGRAAAEAMADAAAREIREGLGRRSHPPRTSTPAPAGGPPARISGTLQRSIFAGSADRTGPARWTAVAGSQGVIYARIQNIGGIIRAKNVPYLTFVQDGVRYFAKQVYIPPRPYIGPAVRDLRESGRMKEASASAFRQAVHGG